MTKELNLFLGDTKEISTGKTNTQASAEKTSGSLFDSILSSVKEEATNSKEAPSSQNKPTQNPTSASETKSAKPILKSDTSDTQKADQKVENNPQSSTGNNSNVSDADETSVNKETKNSNSNSEKSTLSLLDRMMLEAGTKTQSTQNKEIKSVVSTTPSTKVTENVTPSAEEVKTTHKTLPEEENKENKTIDKSVQNKNENNVKASKTTQAATSLFDAIVKEAKSSENKSEVTTNIKNINTDEEGKNTASKENKQTVEQKSLNLDIAKEQITPTNTNSQNVDVLVKESEKNTDDTKTVSTNTVKEDTKPVQEKSLVMDLKEVPKEIKESATTIVDNNNGKNASVPENKDINVKSELVQNKQSEKQDVNKNEIQKQDTDTKNIKQEVNKTEPLKQEVSKENVIVSQKETEVKKVVNNEVQTTKTVETTVVKNENVAKELSKITNSDIESKVNISKEEIDKLPSLDKEEKTVKPEKQDTKEKSLMDKLLDESKQLAKNQNKDEIKVETPKSNETPLKQNVEKSVNPLVANMYLSSQKKNLNDASIAKVATGKKIASEATSVKDVEKSAKFLDLGLEDSEVTVKMQELEKHTKLNILDKLAFTKTAIKQDLINNSEIASKQAVATSSVTATTNENETVVQLNVSPANVTNIESRIIGARQQMGSMMSDVARNMYLNYKPPVTAFRMNLNPGTLGSIAIVMKNDKENGLSISLNMSNSTTLDSFVDNQSALRASLAKNFNTETNFTLDFNMQGQDSNNSGSNTQQDRQHNRNSHDEAVMMQNMENNETQESTVSDYM